jgi:hypothetical protein
MNGGIGNGIIGGLPGNGGIPGGIGIPGGMGGKEEEEEGGGISLKVGSSRIVRCFEQYALHVTSLKP